MIDDDNIYIIVVTVVESKQLRELCPIGESHVTIPVQFH